MRKTRDKRRDQRPISIQPGEKASLWNNNSVYDTQGPGTKEDGYLAYYEICNFVLGRLGFILIL